MRGPADISLPPPGKTLNLGAWTLGPESVRDYLEAVGDSSSLYRTLDAVPPMALAARALGALIGRLSLPGGTIHASQELEARRIVRTGERVFCHATLSRPLQRGAWVFLSVGFSVVDAHEEAVLVGKSTVMLPKRSAGG